MRLVAVLLVAGMIGCSCGSDGGGGTNGGTDAGADADGVDGGDLGGDPVEDGGGNADGDEGSDAGGDGGTDAGGDGGGDAGGDAGGDPGLSPCGLSRVDPAGPSHTFEPTSPDELNPTPVVLQVTNPGPDTIRGVYFSCTNPDDFPFSNRGVGNCTEGGLTSQADPLTPLDLAAGESCSQLVYFWPTGGQPAERHARVDAVCAGGEDLPVVELSGQVAEPATDELVVAPDGTGDACSLAAPCSLTAARDRARGLAPGMQADILISLRGGRYQLDAPLVLGPEDSGQNGYSIVYRAYPGEKPVLSGGTSIDGWQLHDGALGIHRAAAPAGLHTRQLYVDGQRGRRARGELNPPGFSVIVQGYQAPDASLAGWSNPTDVEFVDLVLWKSFRCKLGSVDAGGAVTIQQPCWSLAQWHQNIGMAGPTWIENAFELLDAPGEWYHDRPGGWIYLIPRAGQDPADAQVFAPRLEALLIVEGDLAQPVHHLRFEGLTFSHATWLRPENGDGYPVLQAGVLLTGDPGNPSLEKTPGNVILRRAEDVVIRNCTFSRLGAWGLALESGSKRNLVEGCAFRDISGGAVAVGDIDTPDPGDDRLVSADNQIRDNHISDVGREYLDSPAIFVGYARGTEIEHNELHNLPYSGIAVGWGWSLDPSVAENSRVAYNRVGYAMQRLVDGGLIYTLSTQPGSSIRGNYLHNQVHDYGAVYLDQGSEHFTVEDNVIDSAPNWAILQPTVQPVAQGNLVQNNFSDTDELFCCGAQGCCTDWNTLAGNVTFSPGSYPQAAQTHLAAAGLEPAWAHIRPARTWIEAEAYNHGGYGVGFVDLLPWDAGDGYRDDVVDVFICPACSNDHAVGATLTDEWLAYHLDVPQDGTYDLVLRAATQAGTSAVAFRVDGQDLGTLALPDTGGLTSYQDVVLSDVQLAGGTHLARLTFTGNLYLDGFALVRRGSL